MFNLIASTISYVLGWKLWHKRNRPVMEASSRATSKRFVFIYFCCPTEQINLLCFSSSRVRQLHGRFRPVRLTGNTMLMR